jgi:hypothetical protein
VTLEANLNQYNILGLHFVEEECSKITLLLKMLKRNSKKTMKKWNLKKVGFHLRLRGMSRSNFEINSLNLFLTVTSVT